MLAEMMIVMWWITSATMIGLKYFGMLDASWLVTLTPLWLVSGFILTLATGGIIVHEVERS